jgi:hypothetical protein
MQHAEPGVVQANRPAAHFEPARVPPAHEFPKNVAALENASALGLDGEPLPARRGRMDRSWRPRESRPFVSGCAAREGGRRDRRWRG